MQYDLDEADVKLILSALGAVQVLGVENMRRIVTLADKLKDAKGAPGGG